MLLVSIIFVEQKFIKSRQHIINCLLSCLFLFITSNTWAQEARIPTVAEKTTFLKNFQLILQQIPTNFEKIRKGDAIDFFGQTTYFSTVNLFPIEGIQPTQSIFYIKEANGNTVKSFTEMVPFSLQSCIDMLSPVLKQKAMAEVEPVRKQDSSLTVRSFKSNNAVVELTLNPFTNGTIITIGKPYYYYTATAKPLVANGNSNAGQTKPAEDTKKTEDKVFKGLTKLYKSALTSSGSFADLKMGEDEMPGAAEVYDVSKLVLLESVAKAKLISSPLQSGINGLAIEFAGTSTSVYIAVLNKMSKTPETAGDVVVEKKYSVTRYSLISKSLKKEVISLLDFEESGYNDVVLVNTIYAGKKPTVVENKAIKNGQFKNQVILPPANEELLLAQIKLGLSELISKQANVIEGSFSDMRKGTSIRQENEDIYDVIAQTSLPNIATAQLFVSKNEKGTKGLILNIDPAITAYYINALKAITKSEENGKELGIVTVDKAADGKTNYTYSSKILGSKMVIIIDHPDAKRNDDVLFLSLY